MFKRLSNLFGSNDNDENKRHYDPLHIKITDLRKGFMFDYDLETWQVQEHYEYDWGNNIFTDEYKVSDGKNTRFLYIDTNDDLRVSWNKKVKFVEIDVDLLKKIVKKDEAPKKLEYNNQLFHKVSSDYGHFKKVGSDDEYEFVNWDFETKDNKELISVYRWGEEEIETSYGVYIKEDDISSILPAPEV